MTEIELDAFLADSVAAIQGKLYALGAGWNVITAALFPARHDRIGIGLLIRLPAGSAHTSRSFELRLVGPEDDEQALGSGPDGPFHRISGEFTAGSTEEQMVPIALNINGLQLPRPGRYRFVVSLESRDVKSLSFSVVALASRPSEQPETGTAGYL